MLPFQLKLQNQKSNIQSMNLKPCSIRMRLNTEGVLKVTDNPVSLEETQLPCYLEGRYTCLLPVQRISTLEGEIMGLSMSVYLTSLMEIMDLIDDEIVPLPMPMKVIISFFIYLPPPHRSLQIGGKAEGNMHQKQNS